jgi:5-methyltetrahydrofolate--homocysteine methyltransferase
MLTDIYTQILEGRPEAAGAGIRAALEQGLAPETILQEGMVSAMTEVGRLYEAGEYFIPEMLVAALAMKAGLAVLKPHLLEADLQPLGKVVVGTVHGDMHDIGKHLVAMMLECAGFEVVDLGVDVSPDRFVAAVRQHLPDLVAVSALLTTTMPGMADVIQALQQAGLRAQVKIMVGGAPVTEEFAHSIGADGYAPDASRAVALAKRLLEV